MSEKTNYKEIFNYQPEELSPIFQNFDKDNYLENTLLPNISKYQNQSQCQTSKKNISQIENDIYLSILLIKYKNDLQTNITETILNKNQPEFSCIFNYIISDSIKQKNDFTKKEICIIMLNLCVDHIYINYIKTELIKLCSIFIWVNLTKEKLRNIFNKDKTLLKNFLALAQMNKIKEKEGGILNSIYCCYINSLLEDLIDFFENNDSIPVSYINKGILLLISFLGITNMRKYLMPLLEQKHFIERFNLFINDLKEFNNKKKDTMQVDEDNIYQNYDLEQFEFLFNRFNYYYFFDFIYNEELEEIKIHSKELKKIQKKLYIL